MSPDSSYVTTISPLEFKRSVTCREPIKNYNSTINCVDSSIGFNNFCRNVNLIDINLTFKDLLPENTFIVTSTIDWWRFYISF